MMYCDRSFVKPSIWLRTVRPTCDGRPFASSPFRRLASRGLPFRGFPAWWAMQFAICLDRCLTLHDSVPRYREGSQYQCGRLRDTLSCLLYTALRLGQCQSIVTQTQQPDDIDVACCRILQINSITCSQVGPMSLEWPAAPPGEFDHSSVSPSREDLNDGHVENAHLALPQLRWRRHALQPPEIQRVRLDRNTCVHIPDGGLRCVTWNTRGLIGSPFSAQSSRERKHDYFIRLTKNNDIVCLQEIHGKDKFSRLFRNWPRDSGYMVRFIPKKVNAGGSAICSHKDLLPDEAMVTPCQVRDHIH